MKIKTFVLLQFISLPFLFAQNEKNTINEVVYKLTDSTAFVQYINVNDSTIAVDCYYFLDKTTGKLLNKIWDTKMYYNNSNRVQWLGQYNWHGNNIGLWIEFDTLGNILKKLNYNNDFLVGPYTEYYSNGNIKVNGQCSLDSLEGYRVHIRTGKWETFYENGKIKSYGNYGFDKIEFDLNEKGARIKIGLMADPKGIGYWPIAVKYGEWHYFDETGKETIVLE